MGVKVERRKPRVWLLSVLYRLDKLLPISQRRKLKWYLDLEWVFDRLAMEASFRHFRAEEHPHRRSASDFLFQHLEPGMQVLDLGCGSGDLSVRMAQRVGRVVGVDHDPGIIARAAAHHQAPNLRFLHMDALAYLRQGHDRFDVLVLSHVLEHLDGPEGFLAAFKDHFRWFYIEVPDFDKTFLNHYRLAVGNKLVHTDDDHVSEFDRDELNAILERVGLEVVDAQYRFGVQQLWCRAHRS